MAPLLVRASTHLAILAHLDHKKLLRPMYGDVVRPVFIAAVYETGLPAPQVLSALSVWEMRHLIRRLSGTTVVRP